MGYAQIRSLRLWLLLGLVSGSWYLVVLFYTSDIFFCMGLHSIVPCENHKSVPLPQWQEVVGTWSNDFQVPPSAMEGPVVFQYPDQVDFVEEGAGRKVCQPNPPLVLAMVVTAVAHREKRDFVRRTWGHPALTPQSGVAVVFMLGLTTNPKLQADVEQEIKEHRDVIVANFLDSYNNLTYKTISLLHWAHTRCPRVPFLLKIDDDVYPNPMALRDYLLGLLQQQPHFTQIIGKVKCCDPVLRTGKWAVNKEQFPENGYPPFAAGPSYILPITVIPALLQAMRRTRFLFLEDVFTTGLAAKKVGLTHHNIYSLTNHSPKKSGQLWCSGRVIFQENVGLKEAARCWRAIMRLENITLLT